MSTMSIALSGMSAATQSLDASAHNVANAMTPGFRRQSTVQQAQPEGGVRVTLSTAAEEGSSLETDLVQQKVSALVYQANLATLRTQDRMLGSLLDERA